MISDWELWACAHTVLSQQGENATAFVAERIGALCLVNDQEGIETWKAIAHRLDKLLRNQGQTQ